MALIRELFIKSQEYLRQLEAYEENSEDNEKPEFDMKLEAMIPVLRREIPVKIHAHRADDILTALRLAREFHIRISLDHCTEGHLIADVLTEQAALLA